MIENLKNVPEEDLEYISDQIISQILHAENPLQILESIFPDMKFFYEGFELNHVLGKINALQEAYANPDIVPSEIFWDTAFSKPNLDFGFHKEAINRLVNRMYQTVIENHLQNWQDIIAAFTVSEGQQRDGKPLKLVIVKNDEIGILGEGGPLCSLKRVDDQWYPTPYYDPRLMRGTFGLMGKNYAKLREAIAASPFNYVIGDGFFREIFLQIQSELANGVYHQIETQINSDDMKKADLYISHSAINYLRRKGPKELQYLEYLVAGMTSHRESIYNTIFLAFVERLIQHKKLTESRIQVNVPLTGQTVTVSNPLFELQGLSLREIEDRLAETLTDVRIPGVTTRGYGGYELRAKGWVYNALGKLKELGFDAALGKTMAERV
ncbi:MAG: hypothetical protein N2691_03730 [Patescibacteria group bacterium]|nr:hypothetical protein [Patescibacteria group bacterium]